MAETRQNGSGNVDPAAVEELVDRAQALVGDHDARLAEALAATDFERMPPTRAKRFYTRILLAIREYEEGPLSEETRAQLVDDIRREVDDLVGTVERPPDTVELVELNGLKPQPVRPTPVFNQLPVEMEEGYVELHRLRLWPENARSELHTKEFQEIYDRLPDQDELIKLVTGAIVLPGSKEDPFGLRPLADSIARKGVERPLIVTADGVVLDGNRRWAASHLVLVDDGVGVEQRERARMVRVWKLSANATANQRDAVVVGLNFEPDLKDPWPEYVKARRVAQFYDDLCEQRGHKLTENAIREVKRKVAGRFAIKSQAVTRYIAMVRWADDFEDYNITVADPKRDVGEVGHRTNKIFQWFYEIDAGRGQDKLRKYIETDERTKGVVYDLMYEVLNSGAQVRALHKVMADSEAAAKLLDAHKVLKSDEGDEDDRRAESLRLVKEAIDEAKGRAQSSVGAKAGFDEFLKKVVTRFGKVSPDDWAKVDPELLRDVLRVSHAAVGTVEGLLGAADEERAS